MAPRPAPADLTGEEQVVAGALARAFTGIVVPDDAAAALRRLNADEMVELIRWEPVGLAVSTDVLPVLRDGYLTVAREEAGRLAWAFDPTDMARRWNDVHGARLIVEVTDSARDAVRAVVSQGLGEGRPVPWLMTRVRDTVGLHRRWALAVLRRHGELVASGLGEEQARRASARYAARLRRARAENIARWEVQSARNVGRLDTWRTAVARGTLPAGMLKRWVVAGGACDVCHALAGEAPVAMEGTFSNGLVMPPDHVRCRCTASLVV